MADSSIKALHLERVRTFFSDLPALRAGTTDIILRSYLNIPEDLVPLARKEVEKLHETLKAA